MSFKLNVPVILVNQANVANVVKFIEENSITKVIMIGGVNSVNFPASPVLGPGQGENEPESNEVTEENPGESPEDITEGPEEETEIPINQETNIFAEVAK